jgi:hypothetical protein
MSRLATQIRIAYAPTNEELQLFAKGVIPARYLGLTEDQILALLTQLIEMVVNTDRSYHADLTEGLFGFRNRVNKQRFDEAVKSIPVPGVIASVNDMEALARGELPAGFEEVSYPDLIASVVHADRMYRHGIQVQAYSTLICMRAQAVKAIDEAEAKGQLVYNTYGVNPLMVLLVKDVIDTRLRVANLDTALDECRADSYPRLTVAAEEPHEIDSGQAADLVSALQEAYAIAEDRELKLQIQCNPGNQPANPWYVTAGTADSPLRENDWHSEYTGPRCKSLEIALECFLEAYREPPLKVSVP